MCVGSGGQGVVPPWIFLHGTNIVDRGLIVLLLGILFAILRSFSNGPPLEEAINSAILWSFLLFFGLLPLPHPTWKFFCQRPCLSFNFFLTYRPTA